MQCERAKSAGAYIFCEGMVKLTGRKWIGVVVAVVVVTVGLLWLFRGAMKSSGSTVDLASVEVVAEQVTTKGRAAWALDSAELGIGIDVERSIPGFRDGAFAGASLVPVPAGTTGLTWDAVHDSDGVVVRGHGLWRRHQVEVNWRFVSGDPQSRLRVVVRSVPVGELLEGDILGRVEIGRPVQRFFDEKLRLWGADAAKSGGDGVVWAQWGEDAEALTLSRIIADGAVWGSPSANKSTALEIAFWRKNELDRAVWGCDSMAGKTVDLVVQLDWTVGKSRAVAPAMLPHGYRAALVPVFGDLQSSGNSEMQVGAARSAEDWLGRARTLIYGHSSAEDPRYGNGGLLGSHFGGSVVVPVAWWEDVGVQALAAELEGTRVELVSDGKTEYLAGNEVCERAFRAVEQGTSLLIVPGPGVGDVQSSARREGNVRGLPKVMGVHGLDGRRTSLTEGVFSQDSLEDLLAEHGVTAVSTPLVATRNPLIDLWHEAVLAAERGGEWTLQADVSRAFARGELLRETDRLLISSASGLQNYWHLRAGVDVWQGPAGEVVVYNGGSKAVEGFTFVVAGTVRLSGELDAGQAGVEIAYSDDLTYVSLDLEPGGRHEIFLDLAEASRLEGVRWLLGDE